MLLYKVIKFTPGYNERIVKVFCLRRDAERFADWENQANDNSSFRVESFWPKSITGITCEVDGQTFMIHGVQIW